MKADIEIPKVENVFLAAVQEWSDDFMENIWNVYLVNDSDFDLDSVMVVSKAFGTLDGEMKKTSLGAGSKINHLSYIGDATVGKKVNVGAGTITCNYDGVNKWQTILEDEVFVGSNTALVAPVTVGQGATIGAGSTITGVIPDAALGVARGRQRNIDAWPRPEKVLDAPGLVKKSAKTKVGD